MAETAQQVDSIRPSILQPNIVWPWFVLTGVTWFGLCIVSLLLVPQSDDWFFARIGREMGFLSAYSHMYHTWTGLWVSMALVIGFPTFFGPFWAVRLESLVALHALGFAVYTVLRSLYPNGSKHQSLGAAGGIVALGIVTSQAQEGVYWGATACNYSMGIAWVLLLWSYAYRHPQPSIKHRLVVVFMAMIAPGFSECVAVIAAGLILLGFFLQPASGWLTWAYSFMGLALGSLPVILCPGNAVRLAATGGMRSLGEANALVGSTMVQFADGRMLLMWSIVAALPSVFASSKGQLLPAIRWVSMSVILLLVIGWVAMLPAALGTGEITPHIANLGWYAVFAICVITAWFAGCWFQQSPSHISRTLLGGMLSLFGLGLIGKAYLEAEFMSLGALALVLLGVVIIGSPRFPKRFIVIGSWLLLSLLLLRELAYDVAISAPQRVRIWQQRDALLQAAAARGETVVLVPPLTDQSYPRLSFLTDVTLSPGLGWSGEIATWYNVKRIWVDQRTAMPVHLRQLWEASYAADVKRYDNRVWIPSPLLPAPSEP